MMMISGLVLNRNIVCGIWKKINQWDSLDIIIILLLKVHIIVQLELVKLKVVGLWRIILMLVLKLG
jgi:hypothetical protein